MSTVGERPEALRIRYTLETLPPHPAWCERFDQPRQACATSRGPDALSAVSHNSSWRGQGVFGPTVYLERTDEAGFGLGEVSVTISLGTDEYPMSRQEARDLAECILLHCEFVDRTGLGADGVDDV